MDQIKIYLVEVIKNLISGINSVVNRLALGIVLILIFAIFIYPFFSGGKEVKRVENQMEMIGKALESYYACLLYTSPSPRD